MYRVYQQLMLLPSDFVMKKASLEESDVSKFVRKVFELILQA